MVGYAGTRRQKFPEEAAGGGEQGHLQRAADQLRVRDEGCRVSQLLVRAIAPFEVLTWRIYQVPFSYSVGVHHRRRGPPHEKLRIPPHHHPQRQVSRTPPPLSLACTHWTSFPRHRGGRDLVTDCDSRFGVRQVPVAVPDPDHRHAAPEQPQRALGAPQLPAPGHLQARLQLRAVVQHWTHHG
eukprot:2382758-Rhodomonas_salina.4